jgi:hypothetical protein
MQPPTSAETEIRDTRFCFSLFTPFSWLDPFGNKAQAAGYNYTPCVCLGDRSRPLLLFPFYLVFRLTDNVHGLHDGYNLGLIATTLG